MSAMTFAAVAGDTSATATTDDDLSAIRASSVRILNYAPAIALRQLLDRQGEFDRGLWKAAVDLGWLGIGVPEQHGGFGLDLSARCVIAEEIGRALGAIPFTVTSAAACLIVRFGSTEQQAVIPEIVAGRLLVTVADAASEVVFEQDNLSGTIAMVQGGAFADLVLVRCAGDQVAVVDLRRGAVERHVVDSLDNSRGYADLTFRNAEAESLAGPPAWELLLNELALLTCFEQIGGADACLMLSRDYVLQRRAFGQIIGGFQAIKHALADFYVAGQIARGAALAALRAAPESFSCAVAAARLASTAAYELCAQEAIQLHGGIGGTWEAIPHLHYRRSRCLAQEWGPRAWWRDRLLALTPAARRSDDIVADAGGVSERYRIKARAFLAENAPHYSGPARAGLSLEADLALGRAWQRLKAEHGFAAITVSSDYGGAGGTAIEKIVFAQEEQRYDLPTAYFSISLSMPVPILATCASEELKQELLPSAICGDTIWCQLFSEPAAGSDLAALRMTARRDGDCWILNGQKLWTSWAHISDYGILVARHDPDVPKHQGLTYFIVDMRSAGITVRPVRMLGPNQVNEVFFDDVIIPDKHRLGAVGDGFELAIKTLMIERYQVTDRWGYGPDPLSLLDGSGGVRGIAVDADNADLRNAIAETLCVQRGLAEIHRRAFIAMAAGQEPGPEGSISKLVLMTTRQRLARAAMDALGKRALARRPDLPTRLDWTESWLLAPLSRIAGGTDQILRNTIAEQILRLPQDHRPDKGVAFRDIPK